MTRRIYIRLGQPRNNVDKIYGAYFIVGSEIRLGHVEHKVAPVHHREGNVHKSEHVTFTRGLQVPGVTPALSIV